MSKFQPVPRSMFPMINNLAGGTIPVRVINRGVKQASFYKHKNSTVVNSQLRLTVGISKRLGKAAEELGTTKQAIVASIVHATLPKLEALAAATRKPVKKLCPACNS